MSYAGYIWALLEPLGIYRKNGTFQMGELHAQGEALDGVEAPTTERLRAALAALLRIGGDSFTLEALNDTIAGCGVHALVQENGVPNEVVVTFPMVPGIPKGFEEIREIIEDILPAHLLITYNFWYVTWEELERRISSWQEIEERSLDWEGLETLVLDGEA